MSHRLTKQHRATMSLLGGAIIGFAVAPIFPSLVSGAGSRIGSRHSTNIISI